MIAMDVVLKTEKRETSMEAWRPERKTFLEAMIGPKW